jgi:hypothetical protein
MIIENDQMYVPPCAKCVELEERIQLMLVEIQKIDAQLILFNLLKRENFKLRERLMVHGINYQE